MKRKKMMFNDCTMRFGAFANTCRSKFKCVNHGLTITGVLVGGGLGVLTPPPPPKKKKKKKKKMNHDQGKKGKRREEKKEKKRKRGRRGKKEKKEKEKKETKETGVK